MMNHFVEVPLLQLLLDRFVKQTLIVRNQTIKYFFRILRKTVLECKRKNAIWRAFHKFRFIFEVSYTVQTMERFLLFTTLKCTQKV